MYVYKVLGDVPLYVQVLMAAAITYFTICIKQSRITTLHTSVNNDVP